MKKTLRRVLATLLVFCMAATLGACGGSNNASSGTSTAKTAETTQKTQADTQAQNEVKVDEISFFNGLGWDGGTGFYTEEGSVKEDIVKEGIAKKTGIKISKDIRKESMQLIEKFNVLYAANEVPDLLVVWTDGQGKEMIQKMMQADMIYQWSDDELKQYAPDAFSLISPLAYKLVKERLGTGDKNAVLLTRAGTLSKEGAEKYPDYIKGTQKFGNWENFFKFRDDILKDIIPTATTVADLEAKYKANGGKLSWNDFQIPELSNYDQLKAYLYKVKAKYGSKGVIPYGAPKDLLNIWAKVFYGIGIHGIYNPMIMDVTTGPVDQKDKITSLAKDLNKMYNDGIIDPNYAIDNDDQHKEKLLNGKYAVDKWGEGGSVNDTNIALAGKGVAYRYRPVPISYDTGCQVVNGFGGVRGDAGWGYFINKKTVDEAKMKKILGYLNFTATPEGQDMIMWGPADSGLWEEKDGMRVWKDEGFVKVLTGEIPVGQGKDFAYYGLCPGDGASSDLKYARDYFWYPTLERNALKTGGYTLNAVTNSDKVQLGDEVRKASQQVIKGQFDALYDAWNGSTPTNSVFWAKWNDTQDEMNKALTAKEKSFESKMDSFFKYLDEKIKIQDYAKEQKGFINWMKPQKDSLRFPEGADLSKLN